MKHLTMVLLFLIPLTKSYSQLLTGIVLDENKKPLTGASVYLDGTTIGTTTDNYGKYSLPLKSKINTSLVISFIGYQTRIIQNPFEKPAYKVSLAPKKIELKEVSVRASSVNRKQALELFRMKFIGTTLAGKSCIIENEDDISFSYNTESKTLFASSDKPIVILNPYLGYSININLLDFYIKFNRKGIKSKNITFTTYSGKYLFRDVGNNDKTISERRVETYQGSAKHFFRNLSNNVWGEDKFLLFKGNNQVRPEDFFITSDSSGMKKITVLKNMPKTDTVPFNCDFNVKYNNIDQFNVSFRARNVIVDEFGNNTSATVHFSGKSLRLGIGVMLPNDYIVED